MAERKALERVTVFDKETGECALPLVLFLLEGFIPVFFGKVGFGSNLHLFFFSFLFSGSFVLSDQLVQASL